MTVECINCVDFKDKETIEEKCLHQRFLLLPTRLWATSAGKNICKMFKFGLKTRSDGVYFHSKEGKNVLVSLCDMTTTTNLQTSA